MIEVIKLTAETVKWFVPLLPEEYRLNVVRSSQLYALGAVKDGTACGALVFEIGNMEVDVLYIAVSEVFRRQGAARAMMQYLLHFTNQLEYTVFCTFGSKNQDDPLYLFFIEYPEFSVYQEEGGLYKASKEQLAECKVFDEESHSFTLDKFYDLPNFRQRAFYKKLDAEEVGFGLNPYQSKDAFNRDLCLCITKEGAVKSAVFVQGSRGIFYLSFAYSQMGFQRQFIYLLGCLRAAVLKLTDEDGNVDLYVEAVNKSSEELLFKLLPGCVAEEKYYTAYSDFDFMEEEG